MGVFKEALSKVLDVALEQERAGYQNKFVPFDHYKKKRKIQSMEAYDEYVKRIGHGYNVIIETIEKNNMQIQK